MLSILVTQESEYAQEAKLTWYLTSKLSEVKRRIIEVFPTDWSPRKTILYFI